MTLENEYKKFVIEYFKVISHGAKTSEICDKFMTDQGLKEHVIFFDTIFPNYQLYADEMVAEGNKIMVRARIEGIHKGDFNGIPPTHRKVEFPFVICYTIENGKISNHWMIADQMVLLEQLGVTKAVT